MSKITKKLAKLGFDEVGEGVFIVMGALYDPKQDKIYYLHKKSITNRRDIHFVGLEWSKIKKNPQHLHDETKMEKYTFGNEICLHSACDFYFRKLKDSELHLVRFGTIAAYERQKKNTERFTKNVLKKS